jgi:hypothetical protein
MSHEIFEIHTDLEKVYVTSDNTPFYQENDAKNHAKSLKNKAVETVFNPKTFEVVESEEATAEDTEQAEFEAAEKLAEARAELAKSLLAFDPETTKYPEAVKLFKALGLDAENEKKDTIYPLLIAAKTSAQEGANTPQ